MAYSGFLWLTVAFCLSWKALPFSHVWKTSNSSRVAIIFFRTLIIPQSSGFCFTISVCPTLQLPGVDFFVFICWTLRIWTLQSFVYKFCSHWLLYMSPPPLGRRWAQQLSQGSSRNATSRADTWTQMLRHRIRHVESEPEIRWSLTIFVSVFQINN